MSDPLTIIAVIEWMSLAYLVFVRFHKLDRLMNDTLDEIRKELRND